MSEPDEKDERLDVAARVADGEPVDWDGVSASARTEADRKVLARLRAIAGIAKARAMPSEDRDRWGPLRIIARIGSGSFGDVYRARDPRLDRDVALKLLRPDRLPREETEIIEEARLMARVRHPNVVTIYGAERVDGRTGIWMELLAPRTLAEEITAHGPLPVSLALQTALEVARALVAIHGAGLLHRDVKPQNVLRDDRGAAVLTDFGTGIEGEQHQSPLAGTPLYAAPEVLAGEPPSIRADVYSLGVLLYFLLTARHPVEASSLEDVRDAHRAGRRTALRVRGRFPAGLRAVVDRAVHPDPSARFQSASEMERALEALLQPRDRRLGAAVAALVLLVGAGVFTTWWSAFRTDSVGGRALVRAGAPIPPGMRMGGVSPDGVSVVCSGRQTPLALCHLETGEMTPLTFDPAAGQPDGAFSHFSPDGRRIVYMRRLQSSNPMSPLALHIMHRDGTNDRRLFSPDDHQWFLRPGGWAARANIIVADLKNFDGTHGLVTLDPDSGAMQIVREFDRDDVVETFDISADGRFVVHDIRVGVHGTCDLVVVDTVTRSSWTLVGGDSDEIAPAWLPDGSRVLFSSDRAGTRGIWVQRVIDGRPLGEPEMIMDTGRDQFTPGRAIDGGARILYLRRTGGFDGYRTTLDLSGSPMPARRLSPRALDTIQSPD